MKKIVLIFGLLVVVYLFVKHKGKAGSNQAAGNTNVLPTSKGTPEQTATKPYERMIPPSKELYPRFDEQNPDDVAKIAAQNEALKIQASKVVNYLPQSEAKETKSSFTRTTSK